MIERETIDALIEARERLQVAVDTATGLRMLLLPDAKVSIKDDLPAVRGALLMIRESVSQADALMQSILDKGR